MKTTRNLLSGAVVLVTDPSRPLALSPLADLAGADDPRRGDGSTIQIALLAAPLLVIVSALAGQPMNLVFSRPMELIAIAAVAFTVNVIASDGETTWFEGVLLLATYALFALAFYFV